MTASGSVTYEVTIDEGAAELGQPLTNTACIDSDDTDRGLRQSDVFVGDRRRPRRSGQTAPPTDIAGTERLERSGGSMLLILLALAGIALAVAFVAPTPASIRKRDALTLAVPDGPTDGAPRRKAGAPFSLPGAAGRRVACATPPRVPPLMPL